IRTDPGAVTDFHIVAYYGGVQTLNVTETFDTGGQFKSFGIAEDDSNLWFDAITISARAGDQQTTPSAFMIDNVRAVVPEPASLALFGIGALAVFGGKR